MSDKRQMVYGMQIPPPKLKRLLDDPVKCSKVAAVWDVLQEISTAILMDLPLYCKKKDLDPSAVVLAANRIITTFEVFKDQALMDRQNV